MRPLAATLIVILVIGGAITVYKALTPDNDPVRLTGVVVANEVILAAELGGRIRDLTVTEGSWVSEGDLIAVLDSEELEAEKDRQFAIIGQLTAKLDQARELVDLERERAPSRLAGAEAQLRLARSQREEAVAESEQLKKDVERARGLVREGLLPEQVGEQRETSLRIVAARIQSLADQVMAAEAELEMARANERQVMVALKEVEQTRAQLEQAKAQLAQIMTRLDYTMVKAPLTGMVSLRVARQGEVIKVGDPIVTITDLDDIWVRAELEESYLSRVRVGDKLMVEVASGEEMEGEVTFIAPEAGFATQRDVSRVKRDIRTFGIKVAVPNRERRLHAGMTAYVFLPIEDFGPITAAAPRETPPAMRQQDERFDKVLSSLERVTAALEHLVTDSEKSKARAEELGRRNSAVGVSQSEEGVAQPTPEGARELEKLVARLEKLIAVSEATWAGHSDMTAEVKRQQEERSSESPATGVNEERSEDSVSSVETRAARRETTGSKSPDSGSPATATPEMGRGSEPQVSPRSDGQILPPDEAGKLPDVLSESPGVSDIEIGPSPQGVAGPASPVEGKGSFDDGRPLAEQKSIPHLVLQATVFLGEVPVAMVNGQHVFEGDRVDGVTVTKIRDGVLELEFQDQKFLLRF